MYYLLSFFISLVFCYIFIHINQLNINKGKLNLRDQPQTLHNKSISRLGGTAIYLSLIVTGYINGYLFSDFGITLLALFPVFISGLLDDLGFERRPLIRLLIQSPSAIIFFYLGVQVNDLGLGFIDDFLKIEFLALLFFIFAVIGMTNAFNLIDGINGQLISYIFTLYFAVDIFPSLIGLDMVLLEGARSMTVHTFLILFAFFLLNFPFGKNLSITFPSKSETQNFPQTQF